MMKKHKEKLLISSLVILLPAAAGLILWRIFPEQMAARWGSGIGGAVAILAPPVFFLLLHWLCIRITTADPKNRDQTPKAMGMIFWIAPLLSLWISGIVYTTALGMEFSAVRILYASTGLLFLLIGNYLPKCKQNNTLGIKVTWALHNEENWNRTHRFTGKLWVTGGLLSLLAVFLPASLASPVWIALLLLLAFAPVAYSWLYHRKQVREGTAGPSAAPSHDKSQSLAAKASGLLTAVILAAAAVLLFTGRIQVTYGDTSFTIQSSYWKNLTIGYDEIEAMELRSQDDPGSRTFGFGSPRLEMGAFQNSEFGTYTRYAYTGCQSCIVLTVDGQTIVLSGPDEEATREIYQELMARRDAP